MKKYYKTYASAKQSIAERRKGGEKCITFNRGRHVSRPFVVGTKKEILAYSSEVRKIQCAHSAK